MTRMAMAAVLAGLMAAGLAAQGAGQAPEAAAPAVPEAQPPVVEPRVTTASEPPADPSARVFGSPTGLLLNAIRPDATDDFEMVLARVAQALRTSTDPVRRRQAGGWRFFRATEPGPEGSVLYVFVVDPVVPDADYGVARLLAETFPDEAGALYALYNGAYAPEGQTLLNLQPVASPQNAPVVGPGLTRPPGDAPLVNPEIVR